MRAGFNDHPTINQRINPKQAPLSAVIQPEVGLSASGHQTGPVLVEVRALWQNPSFNYLDITYSTFIIKSAPFTDWIFKLYCGL